MTRDLESRVDVPKVLVVYSKQPASTYLQECAVILVIDCRNNWHGMVKHESISAKEHDKRDFQSTLTALCNFLPQ
jgi:hypothetical protein